MVTGGSEHARLQLSDHRKVVRAARTQPRRYFLQRVLRDRGQHPLGVGEQLAYATGRDIGVEAGLPLGGAQHQPSAVARHQVAVSPPDDRADGPRRRRQRARPGPQPHYLPFHGADDSSQGGVQRGAVRTRGQHDHISRRYPGTPLAGKVHPGATASRQQSRQQSPIVHRKVTWDRQRPAHLWT